jgi:hypothetical protein
MFRHAFGDPTPWRDPGIVRAISAPPRMTASGKILHLHRASPGAMIHAVPEQEPIVRYDDPPRRRLL